MLDLETYVDFGNPAAPVQILEYPLTRTVGDANAPRQEQLETLTWRRPKVRDIEKFRKNGGATGATKASLQLIADLTGLANYALLDDMDVADYQRAEAVVERFFPNGTAE